MSSEGRVSRNVQAMRVSAIKDLAIRAAHVPDVASLTWGLPSFRTPAAIRQGVEARLDSDPDIGKYALPDGLAELRHLVAATHLAATGVRVDPDANVMITAGNMQGLNALFHVLIEPGDEIILTDPGFASHVQQIRLCGGETVFWPLDEGQGWRLDVARLPDLIGPRTKAIVLVTPSNPTGKIFAEAELRRVAEIAETRGVMILLDDPYSHFAYENRPALFNLASIEAHGDHLAYLLTFSKTYAMSGWRLGYMIVPAWLKPEVMKVHDATLICAPRVSQVAGIVALTEDPTHLPEFEAILAKRRELICARLDRVPHVFAYQKPEGAYYVFPRITAEHQDSWSFALDLLATARVAVTPGSAFGPQGEHHVRMAYCVADDVIEQAFDRIEARFGVGG